MYIKSPLTVRDQSTVVADKNINSFAEAVICLELIHVSKTYMMCLPCVFLHSFHLFILSLYVIAE